MYYYFAITGMPSLSPSHPPLLLPLPHLPLPHWPLISGPSVYQPPPWWKRYITRGQIIQFQTRSACSLFRVFQRRNVVAVASSLLCPSLSLTTTRLESSTEKVCEFHSQILQLGRPCSPAHAWSTYLIGCEGRGAVYFNAAFNFSVSLP